MTERTPAKLWSTDRPEFAERIAKLGGTSTFREPWGGSSGTADRMPDAHAVAAALAFARQGPEDIGPDVAYCWVLQTDAYRRKVTTMLAHALRSHHSRWRASERLSAAEAAWDAMVWERSTPKPAGASKDWDAMLLACCCVMHDAAWDSLAEAERVYRKTA